MRYQNYQVDARKEIDEETFLRTLGLDDFEIEMIINSRQERKKWN